MGYAMTQAGEGKRNELRAVNARIETAQRHLSGRDLSGRGGSEVDHGFGNPMGRRVARIKNFTDFLYNRFRASAKVLTK